MKKFLAMILALVMALSLVACGSKDDDKGSVYWLNFKPESKEALEEIATMYTDKTGVEVKVVTAASGEYNTTLTAEMDKEEAPTIFVVGNAAAAKDWSDYCLDLKDTPIYNELNTDAYNVYDENGKLCSIGYCYECYGIIVNTALVEKAGFAADYIKDFATLKEVAETITANKDTLGFSAFASAGNDASSSWRFTGHMINMEYYYESVDDPAAWEKCPAEIKGTYMDNFRNLYDLMVTNSTVDHTALAAGGLDAQAEFAEGKAAFYPQGNWEASGLEGKGMDMSKLAMIPYYGGVAGEEKAGLNCGTENCWAINAKASEADQKATMDFLVWLVTDAEASAKAVATFGVMPYKQAAASTNPFLADANEYANAGHYTMPWVTNFQPNVDAYRGAAVSALNEYNADPTDANWEKVEAAFVGGWAVQYKAVNG